MNEPRTWTMPEQPPDVCVVVGRFTGHRYELNDDGDWRDVDDCDDEIGYDWRDLLAGEGELREVLP